MDLLFLFQSLRPGKPGRKPKRKYGGPHSQMKKKQRLTSTSLDAAEKSETSTSLNNSSLPDIPGPVDLSGSSLLKGDGEAKNAYASYQVEANSGSVGMVRQVGLIEEEKDYDPTLNELRGPISNSNGAGCSQGGGIGSEGDNGRPNGLLKVYPKEFDKNSRFIGAKRRKSGSVKRFKQDGSTSNNHTATTDQNLTQDLTTLDSFGRIARIGNEYPGVLENNNLSQKTKTEELDILKILKPMSFSASVSDNVQDVLVTFLALRFVSLFVGQFSHVEFISVQLYLFAISRRSDGNEVIIDNRFLKAHNPLLVR